MKLTPLSYLIFTLLIALGSCDQNRVFDEYKTLPDHSWNKNNSVVFSFYMEDTTSLHNFYINLRHGGQYQFSNLFLFITTTLPDGIMARDTVELVLSDKDGRWRGKGLGDIWTHSFPFYDKFRFPQKGEYKIAFTQAMRVDVLSSVMDVGLRIETAPQ